MIAAKIIPSQVPNLNAWSAIAVDAALARLATDVAGKPDMGEEKSELRSATQRKEISRETFNPQRKRNVT